MTINVLLFGPQALLAGRPEAEVTLPEGSPTAAEVLGALGDALPELRESLPSSRLAINHEFAEATSKVRSGDEVALVGMVSGG